MNERLIHSGKPKPDTEARETTMFRYIAAFAAFMSIAAPAAAADVPNSGALLLMNVGNYEQELRIKEATWYDENFIRVEGETLDELKTSVDACASVEDLLESAFLPYMPPVQDKLPTRQFVDLNAAWNQEERLFGEKADYLIDGIGIDANCVKYVSVYEGTLASTFIVLRTDDGDLILLNDPEEFRSILDWRVIRARGDAEGFLTMGQVTEGWHSKRNIINNVALGGS